ncbi:phage minor head protein [Pseudogulbenkiania sp. MAI-1]|uniref:phage head morphogenesis protein n=1 Tax=Pseudogulbenkiania sp. MAI-1 TaxID=990370 RepID=UPI00045E9F30|nr:phage minor head protein [Pseudogulbenkiania sp. MAI-1]
MPTADLSYAIGLPPEEAIRYFEGKGYAIGFKWQDVWAEAHARAFTVAGITKLDVLTDIRGALTEAIKNGETLADFQNRLQPLLEAKGWWGKGRVVDQDTGEIHGKRLNPRRLETIFRTNLQSAYMAGRYQEQLANAEARPYWEYVAVLDNRTRPAHRNLHGRVFRYDDPFWQRFYPPNGWNCRCRVRTRSQRDMDRLNLVESSSKGRMETVDQVVDRKGTTRPAPAFNDPATGQRFMADAGFGYNPGRAAYQPELDRYPVDVARQYVQGSLTGPDFARWYQTLENQVAKGLTDQQPVAALRQALAVGQKYPVAVLAGDDMERLGSQSQTVWLSDETLVKQLAHRDSQPVALADYWRVQAVLERPQLVIEEKALHLKFVNRQGRWWVAVVKVTRDGRENYLQSFYTTSDKEVARLKKSGKIIWEG